MTKGTFMFTPASAARIMATYQERGVDMMIDLEHETILSAGKVAARADAKDARGWFRLELRAGELWATDVRWGPDGARRLAEKTQRYISPTFGVNSETGEIVDLVNCALVSDPATHEAPALVAASAHTNISETETAALGVAFARRLRASQSHATLGRQTK